MTRRPARSLAAFLIVLTALGQAAPAHALRNLQPNEREETLQLLRAGMEEKKETSRRARLGVEQLEDRTTPSAALEPAAVFAPAVDPFQGAGQEVRPVLPGAFSALAGESALARVPRAGDTVIELARPMPDWRAGDRLLFTGIFEGSRQEYRIHSVSPDGRMITLDRALQADFRAQPGTEVGLVRLPGGIEWAGFAAAGLAGEPEPALVPGAWTGGDVTAPAQIQDVVWGAFASGTDPFLLSAGAGVSGSIEPDAAADNLDAQIAQVLQQDALLPALAEAITLRQAQGDRDPLVLSSSKDEPAVHQAAQPEPAVNDAAPVPEPVPVRGSTLRQAQSSPRTDRMETVRAEPVEAQTAAPEAPAADTGRRSVLSAAAVAAAGAALVTAGVVAASGRDPAEKKKQPEEPWPAGLIEPPPSRDKAAAWAEKFLKLYQSQSVQNLRERLPAAYRPRLDELDRFRESLGVSRNKLKEQRGSRLSARERAALLEKITQLFTEEPEAVPAAVPAQRNAPEKTEPEQAAPQRLPAQTGSRGWLPSKRAGALATFFLALAGWLGYSGSVSDRTPVVPSPSEPAAVTRVVEEPAVPPAVERPAEPEMRPEVKLPPAVEKKEKEEPAPSVKTPPPVVVEAPVVRSEAKPGTGPETAAAKPAALSVKTGTKRVSIPLIVPEGFYKTTVRDFNAHALGTLAGIFPGPAGNKITPQFFSPGADMAWTGTYNEGRDAQVIVVGQEGMIVKLVRQDGSPALLPETGRPYAAWVEAGRQARIDWDSAGNPAISGDGVVQLRTILPGAAGLADYLKTRGAASGALEGQELQGEGRLMIGGYVNPDHTALWLASDKEMKFVSSDGTALTMGPHRAVRLEVRDGKARLLTSAGQFDSIDQPVPVAESKGGIGIPGEARGIDGVAVEARPLGLPAELSQSFGPEQAGELRGYLAEQLGTEASKVPSFSLSAPVHIGPNRDGKGVSFWSSGPLRYEDRGLHYLWQPGSPAEPTAIELDGYSKEARVSGYRSTYIPHVITEAGMKQVLEHLRYSSTKPHINEVAVELSGKTSLRTTMGSVYRDGSGHITLVPVDGPLTVRSKGKEHTLAMNHPLKLTFRRGVLAVADGQAFASTREAPPEPVKTENAPDIREEQARRLGEAAKQVLPEITVLRDQAEREAKLFHGKAGSWVEYREAITGLYQIPVFRAEAKLLELHRQGLLAKDQKEQERLAKEIRAAVDEHFDAQEKQAEKVLKNRTDDVGIEARLYAGWRSPAYEYNLKKARVAETKAKLELQRIRDFRAMVPDLYLLGSSLPLPEGLTGGEGSLLTILRSVPTPRAETPAPSPKEAQAAFGRVVRKMSDLMGHKAEMIRLEHQMMLIDRDRAYTFRNLGLEAPVTSTAVINLLGRRIEVLQAEHKRVVSQQASLALLDPDWRFSQAVSVVFDPHKLFALPIDRLANGGKLEKSNTGHLETLAGLRAAETEELKKADAINRSLPWAVSEQERVKSGESVKAAESRRKQLEAAKAQQDQILALGLSVPLTGSPPATDLNKALNVIAPGGAFGVSKVGIYSITGDTGTGGGGGKLGVTSINLGPGRALVIESGLGKEELTPFRVSPDQLAPPSMLDPRTFLSMSAPGLDAPLKREEWEPRVKAIKSLQKDQVAERIRELDTQIAVLEDDHRRAVLAGKATAWGDPVTFYAGIPYKIAEVRATQKVLEVELEILTDGYGPALQKKSNLAIQDWWKARHAAVMHRRNFVSAFVGFSERNRTEPEGLLVRYRAEVKLLDLEDAKLQAKIRENQLRMERGGPGGFGVALTVPDVPGTGLPDIAQLHRSAKERGLPMAKTALVKQKDGKLTSVFIQEGFAALTSPVFTGHNAYWEDGMQFAPIPPAWKKDKAFGVLPRLGRISADAGHAVPGLLPIEEGSFRKGLLIEMSGPVTDRFMGPGLYWLVGQEGEDRVSSWPVLFRSLARTDKKGQPVPGETKQSMVIYPIYRTVLIGAKYTTTLVGARVEIAERDRVDEILELREKGIPPPMRYDGKDERGRGYLDASNFFYFGPDGFTQPLPWWGGAARGRVAEQIRLAPGDKDDPLRLKIEKSREFDGEEMKEEGPEEGALLVPQEAFERAAHAKAGPVIHNFSGTRLPDGREVKLPSSAQAAVERLDMELAARGFDGLVQFTRRGASGRVAPPHTGPSAAHLYIEEALIFDLLSDPVLAGRFWRQIDSLGIDRGKVNLIQSYDFSGGRVLKEVGDLLQNGEEVLMVVGEDYAGPLKGRFFSAEGPRPSVAVVGPETNLVNFKQLVEVVRSALMKGGIHEFLPVGAGMEEEKESYTLFYRAA